MLECVPTPLAKKITEELTIPTIGIGAGHLCDGQVLVINDVLGLYKETYQKICKSNMQIYNLIFGEALKA